MNEELIKLANGLNAPIGVAWSSDRATKKLHSCDALARNDSAVKAMGDTQFRAIAEERINGPCGFPGTPNDAREELVRKTLH